MGGGPIGNATNNPKIDKQTLARTCHKSPCTTGARVQTVGKAVHGASSSRISLGNSQKKAKEILNDLLEGLGPGERRARALSMRRRAGEYWLVVRKRKASSKLLKMVSYIAGFPTKLHDAIVIKKVPWNSSVTYYYGPRKIAGVTKNSDVHRMSQVHGYTLDTKAWAQHAMAVYNNKFYKLNTFKTKRTLSNMIFNNTTRIEVFYAHKPKGSPRYTRQTLYHELAHVSLLFQDQPTVDGDRWVTGPGPIPNETVTATRLETAGQIIEKYVEPLVK